MAPNHGLNQLFVGFFIRRPSRIVLRKEVLFDIADLHFDRAVLLVAIAGNDTDLVIGPLAGAMCDDHVDIATLGIVPLRLLRLAGHIADRLARLFKAKSAPILEITQALRTLSQSRRCKREASCEAEGGHAAETRQFTEWVSGLA